MLETSFDAKSTSKNAVWQCFALAGPLKDTSNSELLVRGAGGRLSHPAVSLAIGAWRMRAMSHACAWRARAHGARERLTPACTLTRALLRTGALDARALLRAVVWHARARLD